MTIRKAFCTMCRVKPAHGTYKVESFSGDVRAIETPLCGDCRDGMKHAKVSKLS